MTRTCENPSCGKTFEPRREHGRFCSTDCRYEAWDRANPRVPAETRTTQAEHPLADARGQQESSDLKSKLSQIIYSAIIDRLKYGPVHADDLESAFPEQYRDTCRKLVGAQFGSLASRHYIEEVERRKSSVPSRKGAKSGVFAFTAKGRNTLVGSSAEPSTGAGLRPSGSRRSQTRTDCATSGESEASAGRSPVADSAPSTGLALGKSGKGRASSPSSAAGAGSPEPSITERAPGSPQTKRLGSGDSEPARTLFEVEEPKRPSMFDDWEDAA